MLESTVCQIIRSAFSEDGSLKLPEGLEPSVVYAELQAQAIPGFALLPGELLDACADNALAAAWFNHDLGRRALFGHLLNVQDEMLSVLEAKGIPTVILKGAAAGMLYPDPGLRSYGDIDFMVPPADFERARAALVAAGFEDKDDDGVCLELHWEPNGIPQGTLGLKVLFQEALGHAEAACVQGHSFPVFPPMVNGVVLLLHALLRPFAWVYQAGRCVRVVLARKDIAGSVRFDMGETARRRNLGSEMGLYDR